jgi:hypothetical protein
MPIVNIKGIGQVRFPDTMSQQAIIGAIENDIIPQHEAKIKPAESMRESLVGGAKRGLSSIRTAISAPFDGGQEAGLAGLERQKEIEEKPGASLDYLKYIHETQGPWAAAKELAAQTPRAIAEQVPNLAAMGAGAKAGAMAGARLPLPPQGKAIAGLLGGAAGAFGSSFGPQAGANIERQAQEGKQVDLASAYGTAVPQAGIDVATAALALGKGFGKMLGIDSRLLGTPQAEALAVQKLAQESKKMAVAKGTAKMATLEVPGEVIQQALERYQAGLPLTTPDAMKEYTDTAYQTALMGPVGGASRLAERSSAISKQEEKDYAEAEKVAQAEEAAAKAADDIERAKSYEDQTKADMAGFGAAKNEMAEQDTKAKQVEMLLQTDQGTQHLKDNIAFYLPGKTIKDVAAMKKQMTEQATGVGVQGEMFAGPRGQLPTQDEEVPAEVSTEGQGALFNEKGKPAVGAMQVDPLVINEDMLDTWGIPDKNKKVRADLAKYGDLTNPKNVDEAKGILEGYYEKTGKGQEAIDHLTAVEAEHKKLQAQKKQEQVDNQQAVGDRAKQLQGQGKPTQEAFQQKAEQVRQKIQAFTDREQRQPTQAEIDAMYADHYKDHGVYGQTNLFSEDIEPLGQQKKKEEGVTDGPRDSQADKNQLNLNFNNPRAGKSMGKPILPAATKVKEVVAPKQKAVGAPSRVADAGVAAPIPSTGKKPSALGAAATIWNEESDVAFNSLEKDTQALVKEAHEDNNLSGLTIERLEGLDKRNKSAAKRSKIKADDDADEFADTVFGTSTKAKRKYTAKPEAQKAGKVTITKPQSSQEGDTTKKEEATTTDEINKHINTLFTPQQLKDNPPIVVHTHEELPAHLQEAAKESNSKAFVHGGKSYFIASTMRKGAERGTILHEIGAHLGLEKLVGKDRVTKLANQVAAWAAQVPVGKAKATNEHLIAKEAIEKADLSGEKGDRYNQEVIAYFTEIAVNKYKIDPLEGQPKEHGKVAGWLKELWAGITATLAKLHLSPSKLKAADIVQLVYGAARISNTGVKQSQAASTPEAILSSIGESLDSMPSASPKLMEGARDALSTVPSAVRKAALRFYSIPNMIAQYGDVLPSLKKLLHTMEQRANDSDHRRSVVDKLTHKGVSLLKKYPKHIVDKFNDITFDLSIANLDPTKAENKDSDLVKAYQSLPKPLQDLGNEYAVEYKKHFDEYINILTELAPEKMGREYLSKVEAMRNEFESKSIAWYHPLRRQGDYWLTYTDKNGVSVTTSRESPRAIEREMKLARAKGATGLKQFAKLSQIEYDSKAPPSGFIADVLAQMQKGGAKKEVIDSTYQMYLSLLPAQSLRQQMQGRTGEKGYIKDVVQGFADVGSKMAHQLSAMKHRPDLDNAYAGINREAAEDASAEIKDVYEALMAGKSFVENPVAGTISSRLSWLSYFWHIAGNASSAFVNMTQLPVVVVPMLAGKYGLGATTSAFNRAFKMYANGKFDNNREFMPDFTFGKNPNISQEYKDLYEAALEHSTIRRGVGYELTELRRTSAEDYTGIRSKVETGLGWLFQNSERMNREITLIAAYDLARNKMSPAEARAFAISTTVDAHSHALPEAGPQLFQNNFGKVAFTFKRFAQAQIALMAKLFYNTFKGETKQVRDLALKQMLGIYGTTYAFAGVQGMPLYGAASLLASTVQAMFGDDEEPLDPDEQVKLAVGDMHFKGPINQLLGLDIASRTGFNGMVWREDERRLAEVGGGTYFMEHFFGPAYSTLFINPLRALELFNQGHTDRALETLSPSFVRNPLKAYRFATEGALNRKGAKIVEDVDGLQVFNQILGFTDAELSEAYARAGVMKKVEQHMLTRRQSLLDAFYLANTNGDDDMKGKITENIASFNKAFPSKPITGATLVQSHKTRINNLNNSVDGVYLPPKLRAELLKYRGRDDDDEDDDLI